MRLKVPQEVGLRVLQSMEWSFEATGKEVRSRNNELIREVERVTRIPVTPNHGITNTPLRGTKRQQSGQMGPNIQN